MENFGMATVVVITVIAYLAGEIVKLIDAIPNQMIPVICGAVGGVLGIAAMYIMPDFPAGDVLTAAAVGIVSGLGATGWNQMCKNMTADDEEDV